ncbi:hypothetical protein HYALB_00012080 [Hymenoscyphus albidus]|uniref:Ergosterol biosynthetic protein 28 n=1 Tax=Hymenoscyphus albidus TaxID=595503 RepID=A0A9N9LUS2_9HELO|nr:hypothetical protein HYALB_00012080 [Hymenoscyphus albidus]
MASLLPSYDGLLPYWLLVVSSMAGMATTAAFISTENGSKMYNGPTASRQVSGLSTRLFGTWTSLAMMIRIYAAYNIDNKVAYDICMWSFVVVTAHFGSECWVYGTMRLGKETLPAFMVASLSYAWMFAQRKFYIT